MNYLSLKAFEESSKALKAKDALIAELQGNLKQREMENDVSDKVVVEQKRVASMVVSYVLNCQTTACVFCMYF